MESSLLTLKESAQYMRVSLSTVKMLVRTGRMPTVRCLRRVLVSKKIIEGRMEAGDLAAPAPGEGAFQKVTSGPQISLDIT